jgi:hypothetical protein
MVKCSTKVGKSLVAFVIPATNVHKYHPKIYQGTLLSQLVYTVPFIRKHTTHVGRQAKHCFSSLLQDMMTDTFQRISNLHMMQIPQLVYRSYKIMGAVQFIRGKKERKKERKITVDRETLRLLCVFLIRIPYRSKNVTSYSTKK